MKRKKIIKAEAKQSKKKHTHTHTQKGQTNIIQNKTKYKQKPDSKKGKEQSISKPHFTKTKIKNPTQKGIGSQNKNITKSKSIYKTKVQTTQSIIHKKER